MPKWLAFSIKKSKSRKTNQQNGCPDYCNYYYCLFALARRRNAIRSYFFYLLVRGSCLDDSREILYRRQIIHFLLLFPSYEKERKGKGTKIFTMAAGYVMHYTYTARRSILLFLRMWIRVELSPLWRAGRHWRQRRKRRGKGKEEGHWGNNIFQTLEEGGARVGPYKNKQIVSVFLPILGGLR